MTASIALIGCGRIGFLLEEDPLRYKPCTHYGGAKAAGLQINYACDIDRNRLDKFSRAAGIPPDNISGDYREILERSRPDLAIISTWTNTHHSIGIEAARKGARVIVLEKPSTHNLTQGKKLLDTCRKTGTHLIVSHERRYDSRYIKTRDIIKNGKIGKVISVVGKMITGPYRGSSSIDEGGGPLLHDGTHLVDIIRFFFGDIKTVEGEFSRSSRRKGFEDRAAAWMQTEGGVDVFIEAGGSSSYFQFELDITGSEGRIIVGNGYQSLYLSRKSKFYSGFRDLTEVSYPGYRKSNCFINMYREASAILKGKKERSSSSGIDGYRALEAIHAVYLSSHNNRKKIRLPLSPASVDLKEIFKL
jgi:predicted dehydrogenase